MEALESRILLSGIVADGSKSYKKLTYTDLEGDKVTIALKGGGTFTVDGTNGDTGKQLFSLDTLTLSDITSKSSLSIKVNNVKTNGNGDAFTDIGLITSTSQNLKSISLNGANVSSIDLASTKVGTIVLSATAADILDRTAPGTGYSALSNVNFGAVSALTLDRIQAATSGYASSGNGNGLLNFNGPITVTDGETAIIGSTSELKGAVSVDTVKALNVGYFDSTMTVGGDLTLNITNGAQFGTNAEFQVAGNLHLGVGYNGLNGVKFDVQGSISGITSKTDDVVAINGKVTGVEFETGSTFAGITVVGGNADFTLVDQDNKNVDSIGNVTVSQGSFTGDLKAVGSIGNITIRDGMTGAILSENGSIGNITSANGTVTGNITAGTDPGITGVAATGGNIGNITVAGDLASIAAYNGSIGNVTVSGGGDITSIQAGTDNSASFAATGGNIGNIAMTGAASDLGSVTAYKGNIGNISIADGQITGDIIAGASKGATTHSLVGGDIGTITVVNSTGTIGGGDEALQGSITALNGDVGAVSITNKIAGKAAVLSGESIIGETIGAITLSAAESAAGLDDAVAVATLNIGSANTVINTAQIGTSSIGNISATGSVGTLNINGRASGGGSSGASLGSISINDDSDGSDTVTLALINIFEASNVTIDNGSLTDLTDTNNFLEEIGNVTVGKDITAFNSGSKLTAIGNLTVGNDASLSGLDSATLTDIGNVDVTGIFTIGKLDLQNVSSAGTFTVGQISSDANATVIGSGILGDGSSIGLITIGDSENAGLAGRTVTFQFDIMNGVNSSPSSTVVALLTPNGGGAVTQVTGTEAFTGVGDTQDDITITLV